MIPELRHKMDEAIRKGRAAEREVLRRGFHSLLWALFLGALALVFSCLTQFMAWEHVLWLSIPDNILLVFLVWHCAEYVNEFFQTAKSAANIRQGMEEIVGIRDALAEIGSQEDAGMAGVHAPPETRGIIWN